jgi:hypothetical protein
MTPVQLFLYLLALVLLLCAAGGVTVRRVSLGWLGLAVWVFAAAVLPAVAG